MKKIEHLPLKKQVNKLLDLFQRSIAAKDPALFLYKNAARTPLFMAESLAMLVEPMVKQKMLKRGFKTFKKLEDLLGKVDYYDDLYKTLLKKADVKKPEKVYMIEKRNKSLEKLNKNLSEKEFFQPIFNELAALKINFNDAELVASIKKRILIQIEDSYEFFLEFRGKFTDLEAQVHELRRKLRWISIWSASLDGLIVLKPAKIKYAWEQEFLSKESLDSEYNKVPQKKGLSAYIFFNQKAFYTFNAVIDQLGQIKDKGLLLEATAKSIKKTGVKTNLRPKLEAQNQLHTGYSEEDLLKEAHALLNRFFVRHKIHELLIH